MHRKKALARTRGYACRKASVSCPRKTVGISKKVKIIIDIPDEVIDSLAVISHKEKRSVNGVMMRSIHRYVPTIDGEYPK